MNTQTLDVDFAARLRKLLVQKGWRPAKLSKELNLDTNSTVANYMRGRLPEAAKLKQIARIFNVSTDYLLFGSSGVQTGTYTEIVQKLVTVLEKDEPGAREMLIDSIETRFKKVVEKMAQEDHQDCEVKKTSRKRRAAV